MRSRWEDNADEALDEPVTITERQLRALKRSAKLGMIAMPLAVIALGLGVWSLLGGALTGTKSEVQTAAAQPAPAPAPQAAPTDSGPVPLGGGTAPAAGTAPAGTTPVGSLAKGEPATPTPPAVKPKPRSSARISMRTSRSLVFERCRDTRPSRLNRRRRTVQQRLRSWRARRTEPFSGSFRGIDPAILRGDP